MNNSYKIFVDTGCDIDPELIKGEYVTVIPGSYTVGSTLTKYDGLDDGRNLTKFYDRQRNGDVTQTIAITKEVFENTFSRLVRHGIGVIYIALSSRLSNQYYSAQEVKMEMEAKYGTLPLYIVDSRSATGGIGILAEIAIANKMSGYPISTNVETLNSIAGTVKSWFYVNDLDYLRRNGKTSASKSFIGTLLGVKPVLEITPQGELHQIGKKLGAKKACEMLQDLYVENKKTAQNCPVYITHSDDYQSALTLKNMVLEVSPRTIVKIKTLSPVVGAHTGPGVITIHHLPEY